MKFYFLVLVLILFSYKLNAQLDSLDKISLDGLVKCINQCELYFENQDKLDSLFDEPSLSTDSFRGLNKSDIIKEFKAKFYYGKKKLDKIKILYKTLLDKNERLSYFEIRYRSLSTNKIVIFIFKNYEENTLKINLIQFCLNASYYLRLCPGEEKECIDE